MLNTSNLDLSAKNNIMYYVSFKYIYQFINCAPLLLNFKT